MLSRRAATAFAIASVLGVLATHAESGRACVPAPVITTVDDEVTGYGTFQSHNQKVVSTRFGIFMTYAKTPFDGALWRLLHSTDGGATFRRIWEAVHTTHPPAIEAAADGTLYLVHGDQATGAASFYRLSPLRAFAPELLASVDGAHAQKFSLLLDEARRQMYYAAYLGPNTRFVTLDLRGTVTADYLLTGGEQIARPSYPRMLLSGGTLYVAWSSDLIGGDLDDYYSIHAVRSSDGGVTWQNLAGEALVPPFVGDQDGDTTEVTLPWERPCTTWLTGFAVTESKAHFFYQASPNASEAACTLGANVIRYQRFDLATGVRKSEGAPVIDGVTLENTGGYYINGFFAVSPRDGKLLLTSQTADNRLVVVASDDEGETWRLGSQSEPLADHLYAIGGPRQVGADGRVLGSYTHDSLQPAEEPSAVRFFRATVSRSSP